MTVPSGGLALTKSGFPQNLSYAGHVEEIVNDKLVCDEMSVTLMNLDRFTEC